MWGWPDAYEIRNAEFANQARPSLQEYDAKCKELNIRPLSKEGRKLQKTMLEGKKPHVLDPINAK